MFMGKPFLSQKIGFFFWVEHDFRKLKMTHAGLKALMWTRLGLALLRLNKTAGLKALMWTGLDSGLIKIKLKKKGDDRTI